MSATNGKSQSLKRIGVPITLALGLALFVVTADGAARDLHYSATRMQIAKMLFDTNQAAESKVYEDMQRVATYLDTYVHTNGHLPSEASDLEDFCQKAAAQLPEDPYYKPQANLAPDEPIAGASHAEAIEPDDAKHECRVNVSLDYNLSPKQLSLLEEKTPDNWSADPGKICVVTNGLDAAVIWGASSSHQPIRSHEDGKPMIITLKIR